ncbi:MAG TPA: hypothetical protein VK427_08005 [Kofleriaceae bacterium]|nr:hypothetical protein [Kofleriaceae bacterium]
MKTVTTLLALALASPAFAGGQADSVGVGAEYMMNGLSGGVSVNYDLGKMHFGGFLGFFDRGDETADYTVGGRFFYHLHSTGMSDFGLGGALGFYSNESIAAGNSNRDLFLFIEPSVQIRAFVAANVALSFNLGIVIAAQDADGLAVTGGVATSDPGIGGGVTGGAGVHYYFF